MIEPVFEALRRATEFNIQLQREVFQKWFSLGPGKVAPPNGPAEQIGKIKKEWSAFTAELVKKQRGALESQFSAGLEIVEEAVHLAEAKDPEELWAKTIELWQKAFNCQRWLYESQVRDVLRLQDVVPKWIDVVIKEVAPRKAGAPKEAVTPAA
jgi:hypothetical protein